MKYIPFRITRPDFDGYFIQWNPDSQINRQTIRSGSPITTGPYLTWGHAVNRAYDYAEKGGFTAIDILLPSVARQADLMLIAIRDGVTPTSADLYNMSELLARALRPASSDD